MLCYVISFHIIIALQATQEDELPEVPLLCCSMSNLDTGAVCRGPRTYIYIYTYIHMHAYIYIYIYIYVYMTWDDVARTVGVRRSHLVRSCFALDSLHVQTLMLTDVQTPFLGTPPSFPFNRTLMRQILMIELPGSEPKLGSSTWFMIMRNSLGWLEAKLA